MSIAFFGIELKKGKPSEVQPPEGYVLNLQNAAVNSSDNSASVRIFAKTRSIEDEDLTILLATLRPNMIDQCQLSLVFSYDVPVEFHIETSTKDKECKVYLSGYFQPGPEDDDDDEDMEGMEGMDSEEDDEFGSDDEEDDEETAELYKALAAKGGSSEGDSDSDSDEDGRVEELAESDSDSDSESDDEDKELDEKFINKMIAKNGPSGSSKASVAKVMQNLQSSAPPSKKSAPVKAASATSSGGKHKGGKGQVHQGKGGKKH